MYTLIINTQIEMLKPKNIKHEYLYIYIYIKFAP